MNVDETSGPGRDILRLAVELSPSGVLVTNRNGRIEFVNPRLCELTGYNREELLGQNPSLLRSGRTPREDYRRLWDTITSGRQWSGIFCNRRKNGEFYWEAARVAPVTDARGNITHFLGIKEDITSLKRLEEDLVQARTTGSVGRLASGIAHDFNNLLSAILGFGAPVQRALNGTRLAMISAVSSHRRARHRTGPQSLRPRYPSAVQLNDRARLHAPLHGPAATPSARSPVRLDLESTTASDRAIGPRQLQQVILGLLASRQDSLSLCHAVRIATGTEGSVPPAPRLRPGSTGRYARIDIPPKAPPAPGRSGPSVASILRNHAPS